MIFSDVVGFFYPFEIMVPGVSRLSLRSRGCMTGDRRKNPKEKIIAKKNSEQLENFSQKNIFRQIFRDDKIFNIFH